MQLTHEQKNNYLVVYLKGEFDLNFVENFEDKMYALKDKCNKMIIDFSELEYIDSAGIGTLIQLQTDLGNEEGAELYIFGINDFIYGVLDVANLLSFFNLIDANKKKQLLS